MTGDGLTHRPSWCLHDQVQGAVVLAGHAISVPFPARHHRFVTVSHGHSRSSDLQAPYYRCAATRMVRMGSAVRFRRGAPPQTSRPGRVHHPACCVPLRRSTPFARDLPENHAACPQSTRGVARLVRASSSARRPGARRSGAPGLRRRCGQPSRRWCAGSGRRSRCPRCWPVRRVASWPITSSITRAGMPASSSQVAKVWRKSCAPCRSTASSSGSCGGGRADQSPSPSAVARRAACNSPRARCTVAGRSARPCLARWVVSWSEVSGPPPRSTFRVRAAIGRRLVAGSASLATAAWWVRRKL